MEHLVLWHGLGDGDAAAVHGFLTEELKSHGGVVSASQAAFWDRPLKDIIAGLRGNPEAAQARSDLPPGEGVVYIHGYDREGLFGLMKQIKARLADPKAVAFCTSTRNNLNFTLSQLVAEVRGDHEYMLKMGPAGLKNPRPE